MTDLTYELLEEVRAYRRHESYSAFIKLLQSMNNDYNQDLRYVSKDRLKLKQGASRQLEALIDALLTDSSIVAALKV